MTSYRSCLKCGKRLHVALTAAGRRQLLEFWPDDTGTARVAAYQDAAGTWRARTLKDGERPASHEKLYLPHYAASPLCRPGKRAETPVSVPAGVTSLQAWRDAAAAHAKARRRRRASRAAPRTAGFRIRPGGTT